ncbi:hypothetical protein VTJ83DRAFT_3559 [Remersonia thermophila]|uniref:Uncharacterized protein n=1 Tax=Remersonia thermophila TaxID=72144 RepID=A0ABR4DEB4_9PEZI
MSFAATAPAHSSPALADPLALETADEKKKRRSLFGFGKKKEEPAEKTSVKSAAPAQQRKAPAAPIRTDHPYMPPSSPGRTNLASSPRLASPAGSQIFERDVQESLLPTSPAIPAHIQTENYIPPVLDASSEAITDDHLDPDNVEIITHVSHQPASLVAAAALTNSHEPSWADELATFTAQRATAVPATDTASNYGSFDTTDVRRLSFISFADVVQAEQQQQQHQAAAMGSPRDSMFLAGLTFGSTTRQRSPSPIRSPISSPHGGAGSVSPPRSPPRSVRGDAASYASSSSPHLAAARGVSPAGLRVIPPPLGSPASLVGGMQLGGGGGGTQTVDGEVVVETMRDALRRTGSGDLGAAVAAAAARSFPTSPI